MTRAGQIMEVLAMLPLTQTGKAQKPACPSCALLTRPKRCFMLHAVLQSRLAAPAASAAAPYSQGQKRVALLVHALTSAQVFSRAALARAFAQNPAFLKQELQAWLQKVSIALLLASNLQ